MKVYGKEFRLDNKKSTIRPEARAKGPIDKKFSIFDLSIENVTIIKDRSFAPGRRPYISKRF